MSEHVTANDVVDAVVKMAGQAYNCGVCGGANPDAGYHDDDYHHKEGCPVPLAEMMEGS